MKKFLRQKGWGAIQASRHTLVLHEHRIEADYREQLSTCVHLSLHTILIIPCSPRLNFRFTGRNDINSILPETIPPGFDS